MLLWDFLFLLLVALPLLTGGVWFERPHLRLEYTEPGAAAIVLTLALWWLAKRGTLDPARGRVLRIGAAVWARWVNALSTAPSLTLACAWLAAATAAFVTSFVRHHAFGSGLADLGIFTNGISNVARMGFPMSSLKSGNSLLTDHQDFLLYPLGWIFPIWPSPLFLLLLQALAFTTGGIALDLLGRQRLGANHPVTPLLPLLYWLNGPLRSALRFDVHPEIVMLPLFLFAAYFFQKRALVRGALFLAAALACKESAGPVACGLGLAWLVGAGPEETRAFTRRLGAAVVAVGIAMFYFDAHLLPSLLGVSYAYSDLYAPLGASPLALAVAPFTHPLLFVSRLVNWARIKFFFGVLLPEGFLPPLAPAAFVASLPGILMLFLTEGDHRISLGYHYSVEPMVGLLFALPAALATPLAMRHARKLTVALSLAALLSYGRSDAFFWRHYEATPHQSWVRDEVLPRVRPDARVLSSYGLAAHLANRQWIDQLYDLSSDRVAIADCALMDTSVNNMPMSISDLEAARLILTSQGLAVELHCGTFTLFHRVGLPACLVGPALACPENP